jgi:hypothetical protein
MKERFGVDPQYPIARYVDGFSRSVVPDRTSEHVIEPRAVGSREIADYSGVPRCTNPIFAESLPSPGEELCNRPRGPRSRELVLLTVIGGAPEGLVKNGPDWAKILGRDPDAYDYDGIDTHMIQSVVPRPGLPGPSATRGDNGSDPIHGREFDTNHADLQYACTFELSSPRTCVENDPSCDCPPDGIPFLDGIINPPLCGAQPGQQIRAKAYPSPRPFRVARGLGERGVVGSVCSQTFDDTLTSLALRLAPRLAR